MPTISKIRLCQECGHHSSPAISSCPACGERRDFLDKFQCDQCHQILDAAFCAKCNAPPPLPATPPLHVNTGAPPKTETEVAKEVDPVGDSRNAFLLGLFSLGAVFCCPCVSSIAGLLAIGAAANAASSIPKEKQVGMVRFKIIATYSCGGLAILFDVTRTLVYIFSK